MAPKPEKATAPARQGEPPGADAYLAGIRRAEARGRILYAARTGAAAPDAYAHLSSTGGGGLGYSNTRPLAAVARALLAHYRDRAGLRLLELGPGAGVACSTLARLRPRARLETASLTPIDPYQRFRRDDVYPLLHRRSLRPDAAGSGEPLFAPCRRPIVRLQRIGPFSPASMAAAEPYHVIYENHGPLFYGFVSGDGGAALAALELALTLLRADGAMLVMAADEDGAMVTALRARMPSGGLLVASACGGPYQQRPWLLAGAVSPIAERLRAARDSRPGWEGAVLRLPGTRFEAWACRALGA